MVNKNYLKDLLGRYQAGEANNAEKKLVDDWYDSFDESQTSPLSNSADRKLIKKQLAGNLKAHTQTGRLIKLRPWYYAAASVLVVLGVSLFWITRKPAVATTPGLLVVQAPVGQLKAFQLPDGSKIWLNSGSTLAFDQNTFLTRRDVYLKDGEAFFEVAKDKKHPFRVISKYITTKVYGTSFNVKTYNQLAYSVVHVRTGKVMVHAADKSFPDTLLANDALVYQHSQRQFSKKHVADFNANSWINGVTTINDASFNELSLLFYNQFGIKLISTDSHSAGHLYSITIFHKQPLETALQLICSVHHNHYRREKNVVTIMP